MPPRPFKPPRSVGTHPQAAGSKVGAASTRPTAPTVPRTAANKAIEDEDTAIFDFDSSPLNDIEDAATTNEGPTNRTTTSDVAMDDSGESNHDNAVVPRQPMSSGQGRVYIPPKLVSRLLHDKFKNEEMRITKEAMAAVQIYIETFAKEAIARADEERKQAGGAETGGFLEVEHLEKLYPQLLLDF